MTRASTNTGAYEQAAEARTLRVYAPGTASLMGSKAGYLTIQDNSEDTIDDTNNTPLRSEGMFVAAETGAADGDLTSADLIAADAAHVPPTAWVALRLLTS